MASLSIIIPFYKDFAYIEQAVNSVLMQNLSDFEIVIVNDNPGEFSQSFLADCRFPEDVKIVTHESNRGLSAARNTGFTNSTGDFVAYLDADDYYLPQGLSHQFEMASASGCDVTHATTILRERQLSGNVFQQLVARDQQMFNRDKERTDLAGTPEMQFIISSWKSIYRREHLNRTKILFDEAQRKFEDRLYVLENVFSGGSFAFVSRPSRIWRRRPGSITTSEKSDADIVMMTNLIDKCTALVERKVRSDSLPGIFLQREVFHSVARLLWDTGILDFALKETELAYTLRPILERAIGRAEIDANIFSDAVIKNIDRTSLPNPKGVAVNSRTFIEISRLITRGDWSALSSVYPPPGIIKPADGARVSHKTIKPVSTNNAMDDVELVIHIGLHKTGTTHLQHQFLQHRDQLLTKGWLFPLTGFTSHQDTAAKAGATPGHQGILRAALDGDRAVLKELMSEIQSSGCKKILISCENMSFPYYPDAQRERYMGTFENFFSGFDKRRVVASIRQPAAYFEALYRERVTNSTLRESRSALQFYTTHGQTILSFAAMLGPWKEFARGNLDLTSYDQMRKEPDYFTAFCQFLGIDIQAITGTKSATYASPGRETIEMVRAINAIMPPNKVKAATVQSFMSIAGKRAPENQSLSVLPPQTRIEMTDFAQDQSEKFFADCGLEMDFDQIRAAIEKEGGSWKSISTFDHDLVLALIHSKTMEDSQAVGSGIGTYRSTGGVGGALPPRLSSWLKSPFVKSRLIKIYNRLPAGAKKLARKAYSRVAG